MSIKLNLFESEINYGRAIKKVFDVLTRVEKQNLEILSTITTTKASRKSLSVAEAAKRLDRSAWTIRQLCNSGQIKAVKDNNGRWKISNDEVVRLEEAGVPTLPKRSIQKDAAPQLRNQDPGIGASCNPSYAQAC